MAVLKRLPLLTVLLVDIASKKGTSAGLSSVSGPGDYEAIEAVALQALTNAKLPPGTPVPMTRTAWLDGWGEAMKQDGQPPKFPQFNRALLLGQHIQYLLSITQWLCPICLKRLLRQHDLEDMFAVAAAMMTLHFDHCIPSIKNPDYHPLGYWYHHPMVLDFFLEKLSGCFVHQACHKKGAFN
jgi:hypothetical protein